MIQAWTGLSIETQSWIALSIGWCMLVVSATIREKTPPGECRNWARAMGVVAVGLMSLQTVRVTMLVQELNTELMVRRGTHDVEETEAVATQIADPVRVVAVASEFSATTGNGFNVSITKYGGGRLGPLSIVPGRGGFNAFTDRSTPVGNGGISAALGGPNGRVGGLSSGTSGVSF